MRHVICHYHIYKNSGTTFDHLLERNFGDRHLRFDGPFPYFSIGQRELAKVIARNRSCVAFSSHQISLPIPASLDFNVLPVVFVRHPTAGGYLEFEHRAFPRERTWDVLLARTGARGVHFEDHPELAEGLEFPEWSHMSRDSAERYTERLYRLLEREHPLQDGRRW